MKEIDTEKIRELLKNVIRATTKQPRLQTSNEEIVSKQLNQALSLLPKSETHQCKVCEQIFYTCNPLNAEGICHNCRPESCETCGGSGRIRGTPEGAYQSGEVGMKPCPDCQAPAGSVEEFIEETRIGLLNTKIDLRFEPVKRYMEQACTHLAALLKQIKQLEKQIKRQANRLVKQLGFLKESYEEIQQLEGELIQVKRARNIEQGAWEEVKGYQDKIAQLEGEVNNVREALLVLNRLRVLYQSSANMLSEPVQSAAKLMMKQAEEGIVLAEKRRQQEYINKLQIKIEELEGENECVVKWMDEAAEAKEGIAKLVGVAQEIIDSPPSRHAPNWIVIKLAQALQKEKE